MMKKLIFKIVLYSFLITICLEVFVRVFHLYFEYPLVEITEDNILNYKPDQRGYYVVGNRRMNFAKYEINKNGFNSYREFKPTENNFEVALIGDSFIEGLHQNYHNSIGSKIENNLENKVSVFEYGFSGYDLADQLHLIQQYEDDMAVIDLIVIYLNFSNDVKRDEYEPDQGRAAIDENPLFKIKREVKLLSYMHGIGLLDPIINPILNRQNQGAEKQASNGESQNLEKEYLENFKNLIQKYPIDKDKTIFLIDQSKTSMLFTQFCDDNEIKYLDFGDELNQSNRRTTLVFDKHWNNHGRNIIASVISDFILKRL